MLFRALASGVRLRAVTTACAGVGARPAVIGRRWLSSAGEAGPGDRKAPSQQTNVEGNSPALPEGISEEDMLKFLADPESEGSPFRKARTPPASVSASGRAGSSQDEDFQGESRNQEQETPATAKSALASMLQSNPLRPGQVYDPLTLLNAAGAADVNQSRPIRRGQRPQRLIVTGKEIHFTNVWLLSRFVSPLGRILPRYKTGLSPRKQRKLAAAIKRSQQMGLMPYLHRYEEGVLAQAPGELQRNPLAAPERPQRS